MSSDIIKESTDINNIKALKKIHKSKSNNVFKKLHEKHKNEKKKLLFLEEGNFEYSNTWNLPLE